MDFEELQDFIAHKMQMSHIYQPLMIKTLLESDNEATAEDIARGFLNEDKAQLEYYTRKSSGVLSVVWVPIKAI